MNREEKAKINIRYISTSESAQEQKPPPYSPPNSQSTQKTIEGEVRIGAFHNQKHVEKL
jgi:hypothetical protein